MITDARCSGGVLTSRGITDQSRISLAGEIMLMSAIEKREAGGSGVQVPGHGDERSGPLDPAESGGRVNLINIRGVGPMQVAVPASLGVAMIISLGASITIALSRLPSA